MDWTVSTLGEIGETLTGLTYSPSQITKTGGTLVLRSSNVQDGQLSLDDTVHVNTLIPEKIRVRRSDVLICVRNGSRTLIGKSLYLDERIEGQTFGAFMAIFRSSLNYYLRYFFQSEEFKRQVEGHLGATINQITNKSLKGFEVGYPGSRERIEIARRLADVDALVESLAQLIAKKRAVRQGMMQELLTGRTRLPGFSAPWISATFADVVRIQRGSIMTRAGAGQGSVPVVAGGKSPAGYTDIPNRIGKTITISASGASAGYVALYNGPIYASDCSTIGSADHYDLDFIYYSLSLRQDEIYRAQTGGAQPHIHARDVYPIELQLPADVMEQAGIGRVIKDADAEIDALERRLESTRAIKQGMMQELLTGRTRLPATKEVSA